MEKIGLSTNKAEELLKKYGENRLPEKRAVSFITVLFSQFNNPMSYLLISAAILSFFIADLTDALLIILILFLNVFLGFWQEYKASKELEALRKLEVDKCRVIRDGKQMEIASYFLVPGDIVVIESGDKIPADGKLVESVLLQVNESSLSGESMPVAKSLEGDDNEVYFGTVATGGRGVFEVTETGANTKFGKISLSLALIEDEPTALEVSLKKFSKNVILLMLVTVLIIFFIRVLQGVSPLLLVVPSIALFIAAVPEGLPTVVTIVLAAGVRKMYLKKALVRKMIAVESLGSVTVICTDKTGTLTENKMTVKASELAMSVDLLSLMKCAVLCNSAELVLKEDRLGESDVLGDATEGALLVWAKENGLDIDQIRNQGKIIEEVPFSLESRMMTVVWEDVKKYTYTKGAPEVILEKVDITGQEKENWLEKNKEMAEKGLRVLAFSRNNKFLGLIGITDPIREGIKTAVLKTMQAGIKLVMITGDNPLTAKAIAKEAGILRQGDEIMTGIQLMSLTDEELIERIDRIKIFARIDPQQKYRIVKAYQSKGEIVAVTGDGVNDALALKQAEVGISMGIIGTDVAKEASDIVLLDDNFATLVSAVEQGRLIYNNISKVIRFLLMGNLSEVMFIGATALLGLPPPLLPIHILWINFVTDGLPALALGFDSPSPHLMSTPPRRNGSLLDGKIMKEIIIVGLILLIIFLVPFYITLNFFDLSLARTVAFSVVVLIQMLLPFLIRRHHSIFSNKKLLYSVILVILMQVAIVTVPVLRGLFKL